MTDELITQIDALLPQTQCGLCDYGGCKPYATAIVREQEAIDKCPPGGINTLIQLAQLLERDPTPLIPSMQKIAKPPLRAVIREAECIGCTKCLQACPVDAIVGSAKQMHTVIQSECTGCELCVTPCPVDCIDIVEVTESHDKDKARMRFTNRNTRLQKQHTEREQTRIAEKKQRELAKKRAEIAAAVARVHAKRNHSGISHE